MIVRLFPWILLSACGLSLIHPPIFTWYSGKLIPLGLGMIMVGMGLNLEWESFLLVKNTKSSVAIGVLLQYTIMPFLGYSIGTLLDLPPNLFIGLILVASCPGGTASNVIVFLAKGNLPLSVVLTSISTLLAVGITPLWASLLLSSRVEVDSWGLFLSTIQVVLVPIGIGILGNQFFPSIAERGRKVSGFISVFFITLIVASIIGSGKDILLSGDWKIYISAFLLHLGGFFMGYGLVKWIAGRNEEEARTISIEVGMQNSGLGAVLARENFTSPETAIPSAISSLIHSLIGSFLAGIWRNSSDFSVDSRRVG